MLAHGASVVDELLPQQTYDLLSNDQPAALVDVRTRAEWSFVGVPDIQALGKPMWLVEWVTFPTMAPNVRFVEQLSEHSGGALPERLFFICRSGARSMMAAHAVAEAMQGLGRPLHCTNVAEGFEGDLDEQGHRGKHNGWKARGLPWRQA